MSAFHLNENKQPPSLSRCPPLPPSLPDFFSSLIPSYLLYYHLFILPPSLLYFNFFPPILLSSLLALYTHAFLLICLFLFLFTFELQRLETVLASITAREGVEKDSMDLLLKFRKQTVRRLQHLQDIKKVHRDVVWCCGLPFLVLISLIFSLPFLFFCSNF